MSNTAFAVQIKNETDSMGIWMFGISNITANSFETTTELGSANPEYYSYKFKDSSHRVAIVTPKRKVTFYNECEPEEMDLLRTVNPKTEHGLVLASITASMWANANLLLTNAILSA